MPERLKSIVYIEVGASDGPIGESGLPLHVTVTPPFEHEISDTEILDKVIADTLHDVSAFDVTGLEQAYFGNDEQIRDKSIPVRKIASKALHDVHGELLASISEAGFMIDTTFAGDRYSPHATYIGEYGVDEGQIITITAMKLAQKRSGGQWQSYARYELGES